MAQQLSNPQEPPTDFDHRLVLFPTRYAPYVPAGLPAPSGVCPHQGHQPQIKSLEIRQITVLEMVDLGHDVAKDLDQAIQLALGEGPRGVVCDLTASLEDADPEAVEALAAAGRHARDWPGIPVAVACSDQRVREVLTAHPLGRHLILAESLFSALSKVLSTPTLAAERLRLAPHPTAPRAAREFVARTLLDWRLARTIPFASLVVSELVASSSIHAGTDIDLTLVWDREALRLSVRDHGPAAAGQMPYDTALQGRGLTVVNGISRAFGVLPAADGGKVVWAVLNAPGAPIPPASNLATLTTASL